MLKGKLHSLCSERFCAVKDFSCVSILTFFLSDFRNAYTNMMPIKLIENHKTNKVYSPSLVRKQRYLSTPSLSQISEEDDYENQNNTNISRKGLNKYKREVLKNMTVVQKANLERFPGGVTTARKNNDDNSYKNNGQNGLYHLKLERIESGETLQTAKRRFSH